MKIGYDAKRAFLNRTGLGNYSRWLVKTLAHHYPDHQYFLYTPRIKPDEHSGFFRGLKNVVAKTPASKLLTSLWRSRSIVKDLKRDGINLYHGLSHELPVGIDTSGIKSVVTVHDLIFMRYPEYFGSISRRIYLRKLKYACKIADRVIAISQKTRQDLVDLLGVDPKKIEVIYQGCDQAFGIKQIEAKKEAVMNHYNLPPKFILNIGTIEPRKNLLLIVKALLKTDVGIPLVVIGKPTKYQEEVERFITANDLMNQVIFLNKVPFEDLPAIYQLASVFVYPSRYEGFGIPVLEALNSGTPVIAATGSCLEEAGGPDSSYIDADDDDDLAKKIDMVLSNDAVSQNMIAKGYQYAQNFTDEKLAGQLMNLYQNI